MSSSTTDYEKACLRLHGNHLHSLHEYATSDTNYRRQMTRFDERLEQMRGGLYHSFLHYAEPDDKRNVNARAALYCMQAMVHECKGIDTTDAKVPDDATLLAAGQKLAERIHGPAVTSYLVHWTTRALSLLFGDENPECNDSVIYVKGHVCHPDCDQQSPARDDFSHCSEFKTWFMDNSDKSVRIQLERRQYENIRCAPDLRWSFIQGRNTYINVNVKNLAITVRNIALVMQFKEALTILRNRDKQARARKSALAMEIDD